MDRFVQSDFSGGMNLFNDPTNIAANEYVVGFNIRNRTSSLDPIADAEKDTTAPTGLKQGLYGFDKYLILFNAGKALYKNIITDSGWTQIVDFSMDPLVTRMYAEAVPQSSNNLHRVLVDETKINGTQLQQAVNTTPNIITGSVGGLVVQDGKNQPWLIKSDGTARITKNYTQWHLGVREYVPIMKQMKYINGILLGVDPDGTSLYRSLTGRPLDFVVNVDKNGEKGGDAKTTNYAVSPFEITCLAALNSGELFVGTLKTCHPITFDYQNTIFAEPKFLNTKTMAVGVTNQFSFIDVIGDYTFIDLDGLRSFNAVNSDKDEGRTSVFSLKINKALEKRVGRRFVPIKQDAETTAAIVFHNFSFYSLNTTYGQVIAVFDNMRQVWCSFDILDLDGPIKQFAIADQSENPTVYGITATSVYKLYNSDEFAQAEVRLGAVTSGLCSRRLKTNYIWAAFDESDEVTTTQAGVAVDNKTPVYVNQQLSSDSGIDIKTFNFQGKGTQGWKIQPILKWQTAASLDQVEIDFNEITSPVDVKQAGKAYAN